MDTTGRIQRAEQVFGRIAKIFDDGSVEVRRLDDLLDAVGRGDKSEVDRLLLLGGTAGDDGNGA
jgi:hypothetical protein